MKEDTQYRDIESAIASLAARVTRLEMTLLPTAKPTVEAPPIPAPRPVPVAASSPAPDLEHAIGGRWLNRIGIVAFLFGTSYFLKYAFDSGWIGPATRVLLGLSGGLGIVYYSEYIRKRGEDAFSYSLKALGLGILYLSLWASSQLYALVPPGLAFVGMVLVTVCTTGMALILDSQLIAGFGAIGAFLTPVLLSTRENRALSLFTYIALLDVGILCLVRYRPWARIAIGAFAGTMLLLSSWHAQHYSADQFQLAFVAAASFFALFLVLPILCRGIGTRLGLALILANAVLSFLWISSLLRSIGHPKLSAVAAAVLVAVYFLVSLGKQSSTFNLCYRLLGFAFLTISGPIAFEGHWISIFWFAEAVALEWLSRRTALGYPTMCAAAVLFLGVFRLILVDSFAVTRLIFNERLGTYALAIAAVVLIARTMETSLQVKLPFFPKALILVNVLALLALNAEVHDLWQRQGAFSGNLQLARDFTYSALWIAYGGALMAAGFWKKSSLIRWQALVLIAITVCKVFLYDTLSLDRGYRIVSFVALGVLLLGISFFYQRNNRSRPGATAGLKTGS
jgi:uncharacterized membrane protein